MKLVIKKITPFLVFLIGSQFISLTFLYFSFYPKLHSYSFEPFGGDVKGGFANSLLLLSVSLISLFCVYLLFKYRMFSLLRFILTLLFSVSLASLSYFLLPSNLHFFLPLLLLLPLLSVYVRKLFFLRPLISLIAAAEAASYLAVLLKPPTAYIFPLLMAFYDIYAVFLGPLGKIFKGRKVGRGVELFPLLLVNFGPVNVGLGDLIFYSMIPCMGYIQFGLLGFLISGFLTNVGSVITLTLFLRRRRPLPGLPIPMVLGVASLILLSIL